MGFDAALVGLDLSKISDLMVEWLPNLSKLCTRRLYLLHVIPLASVEHVAAGPSTYKLIESEVLGSKRRLEEYANKLVKQGFDVVVLDPEPGEPAKVIVKLSEELQVDYIALGSRGHSWLSEILLGSTVEEVSHTSKKRVMVIKGFIEPGTRNLRVPPPLFAGSPVVVAVDVESVECTKPVIKCVRELCECYVKCCGRGEPVVHIIYVDEHGIGRTEALRRLEEFFDELKNLAKVKFEVCERGSPAKVVLSRARELGAELIVVGPCGKGGSLARRLLGTTADVILRRSHTHVLICK